MNFQPQMHADARRFRGIRAHPWNPCLHLRLSACICGFLLVLGSLVRADTDFYVDSGRTSNGSGTLASPWKLVSDINWTTVGTSSATNLVRVYFSSRSTWTGAGNMNIAASGQSATTNLFIIGDTKYNTNATGDAVWTTETTGSRATIEGTGAAGGNVYIDSGRSNVFLQGMELDKPTFGGIVIGQENPANNIKYITVTNCFVHDVVNSTGISFLFAETNVHDITISHCIVSNTPAEAIYAGHYSYLSDTITNVLIQNNLIVNCGIAGAQGDIDVKPPCYGAIIRYNIHTNSPSYTSQSSCGVVCVADNCQIYGNVFHNQIKDGANDWGYGIQVAGEGADGVAKSINSILIYNNLIARNQKHGIKIFQTALTNSVPGWVRGVKIWNNTVWSNGESGLRVNTANGCTVGISEIYNNIFAASTNANEDIYLVDTGCVITNCNNNLYYRTSGNSWNYQGSNKTWAQWQALGFDANGVQNSNPNFTDATNFDFRIGSNSPCKDGGLTLADFNVDFAGASRPQFSAWDIGAYEFVDTTGTNKLILRGIVTLNGNITLK